MEKLPSKLLDQAVEQFNTLPGIGRRTAMRLALNLLSKNKKEVHQFAQSFISLIEGINYCTSCYNISDTEICSICNSTSREKDTVCVVEDIRDVIAIENTMQYRGVYHVLGGKISPMDGIGPKDLKIDELLNRVINGNVREIILAMSTTMEGDTTNFYLYKKLHSLDVKITTIARGVSIGDELEYADELTLGKSLIDRVPYENSFIK